MSATLVRLDASQVQSLDRRVVVEVFLPAVVAAEYPERDPRMVRRSLRRQGDERMTTWSLTVAAVVDGRLAGIAWARSTRRITHAWLDWLLVHPDMQGHGLGGRLHDAVVSRTPFDVVGGRTHASAERACALYRGRGWILEPGQDGWISMTGDRRMATRREPIEDPAALDGLLGPPLIPIPAVGEDATLDLFGEADRGTRARPPHPMPRHDPMPCR